MTATRFEWQLIETAPKDGTLVLLSNGKEVRIGWGCKYKPFFSGKGNGKVWTWAVNWNSEFNEPDETIAATHWMPLPEPPL